MPNRTLKRKLSVRIIFIFFLLMSVETSLAQNILIGLNIPLSGPYSRQGKDQLRAYMLAIETVNRNGGVLGNKLVFEVRDTRTDPAVAQANAIELINRGALMITGGASSAEAIAQAEICQRFKILFMAGLSHSNETTGRFGHRYSFRWYNNGHQAAKALAPVLKKRFGSDATYGIIYADYTWGKTFARSLTKVIQDTGGSVLISLPTTLGSTSFFKVLLSVKRERPDVLMLVHFGNDMITSLTQATSLELRKEMEIVVPLMEINMADALGSEVMQGILATTTWYHGLSEKYEGSRKFVEMFEHRYHRKPGNAAATAWVNIFQYTDAIERSGSTSGSDIIRALEGHHFTLLGSEEYWRSWDHQGIHPTYIIEGKRPEESDNRWDLFKIVDMREGEEIARTKQDNPVALEPLD